MFKLVKLLGRLVAKLYAREARLKHSEAKAMKLMQKETSEFAEELMVKAAAFGEKSEELTNEAARVALQAQTVGKFFE